MPNNNLYNFVNRDDFNPVYYAPNGLEGFAKDFNKAGNPYCRLNIKDGAGFVLLGESISYTLIEQHISIYQI